MNKIAIIIKREYLTRVRKKSFIIMTILAPLLMAGFVILVPLIMLSGDKDFKKIAVIEDRTEIFRNIIPDTKHEKFIYLDGANINDLIPSFHEAGYFGVLYLSPDALNNPILYSKKQPDIGLLDHISGSMKKEIEKQKLLTYNIQNLDSILTQIRTNVSVSTKLVDEKGKTTQTSTGIAMALAYIGGLLMYMLVFIFGSQVMRGVIEEKTNRVVEVLVSSVKPAELMMGKITGIALVGLTQFLIWILLTIGAVAIVKSTVLNKTNIQEITESVSRDVMAPGQQPVTAGQSAQISPELAEFSKIFDSAMNQNWPLIILSFIFYFITGYLLYAAVFAAIGSAVDNETETQQFMLPVTIPIILALLVAMGTMQNPESSIAFWFSIIPFTSPIVMIARIPFGVPAWQIMVSMLLMIITFISFVWMAGKVYRTGILMYGKKSSWKELWKWLRYSG
ncbi:MAG TPA: ABC transporter permease [Bacteroidales bacterium]|nr:ABC transporter permease [Bacteroidales bacterium]